MDSQRLILFFVFSFSLFFLMDAWQRDQKPLTPSTQTTVPAAPPAKGVVPSAPIPPAPSGAATAVPVTPQSSTPSPSATVAKSEVVKVETDNLRAEIGL